MVEEVLESQARAGLVEVWQALAQCSGATWPGVESVESHAS